MAEAEADGINYFSSNMQWGHVVCVTGAGGFIASWLVQYLLQRGYIVRGTVRNPDDPKNSHLKSLEGARYRLTLFKADVLNYSSVLHALQGCRGVFHTACPVTNDPDEAVTAIDGAKNVINAAADAGIHRVVFTSSFGAVFMNPNRSPDAVVDESCWSDLDFCKKTNNWYCYAKTVAELSAMKEARKRGVDLLSVVPHVTVGPMLQPSLNASVFRVLTYVRGTKKAYPNAVMGVVDVRDVALSHILVYEEPTASGRYICIESVIHRSEYVGMLAEMFPEYPVTTRSEDSGEPVKAFEISNQRLKDLGLKYISIKESLYATVQSLQEKGHLPLPDALHFPPHRHSSL